MKINGLATYQIVDENADIALSVEFTKEEMKEYDLNSTTVWVTYDLNGNYRQSSIADEGIAVELQLTSEELQQVLKYIDDNGLKSELLRQINHA